MEKVCMEIKWEIIIDGCAFCDQILLPTDFVDGWCQTCFLKLFLATRIDNLWNGRCLNCKPTQLEMSSTCYQHIGVSCKCQEFSKKCCVAKC